MTGRLEAEYDRIQSLYAEIAQLKISAEDLRTIQLYPAVLTKLTAELTLSIEKRIKDNETAADNLENSLSIVNVPLSDAIGILKELIQEDKERQMLTLLDKESRERALSITVLKRKMNGIWRTQEAILGDLMKAAGINYQKETDKEGFEAEFFNVLYFNLGMTSDHFHTMLTTYRDTLAGRMDEAGAKAAASAEFMTAVRRLETGNPIAAERDLLDIEKRYGRLMAMNGVFYNLGLAAQATGRHNDAITYFSQVAKNSPYYTRSFSGTLRSLYSDGKFSRIYFMFEKFQNDLSKDENLNIIYLSVAQAYYELRRDKAIIDLAARVEKGKPGYIGILFVLGQSYARQKDFATATALFKTVLEQKKPDNVDMPFINRAKLALAHIDYEEKKYRQSLKGYISLLNEPDYFTEAMHGTAWSFVQLGQFDKAEIALKKLINQSPNEPLGCEALLTLSELTLRTAQKHRQHIKDVLEDISRISRLKKVLDLRLATQEIDTSRYREALRRLSKTESSISTPDAAQYAHLDSLYRRALESADLHIKVYSSGRFLPNPQKNIKEDLLFRIHDLSIQSSSGKKRRSKSDIDRQLMESGRNRSRILDVVIRARMFRIRMLLERREWAQVYAAYIIQTVDARCSAIEADASIPENQKKIDIAKRIELKDALVGDLDRERSRSMQLVIDEINRTRTHVLDDEQDAFSLYHLGEAQYAIAQDNYLKAEAEFEKDVEKYRQDKTIKRPVAPVIDYGPSRATFELLVSRYPESEYTDAALYSLMFQYSEEGERNKAVQYGEQLVQSFPKSEYAPQTNLLLGEVYFDSSKLDKALKKYEAVIKVPNSKWFSTALYKIGWTYYRLSDLKKAISAFFYLIREQDETTEGGLDLEVAKKSLLTKEAIDYIAISFAEGDSSFEEAQGLKKARQFVKKINNAFVGSSILHKLGNVYKDQLRYTEAIESYKALKTEYPDYRDLPSVMYSVIECFEQKGQIPAANEGRRQLFLRHNHLSDWAKAVHDTAAVKIGDSLAEMALLEAASYTYSLAIEKKSTDLYRQAVDYYWDYIRTYPNKEKAGDCHYSIAEILFGEGNYLEAAKQYMEVSRRYKSSKYRETAAMNAIVAAQQLLKKERGGVDAP
jgi:tetratricopeptide (TPR) repeat protein